MTTNDLKKGTIVYLRNGWRARLEDNKKGNIRMATVYGIYEEIGSVYAHDIVSAEIAGQTYVVEHTAKQNQCRKMNAELFG